MIKVEVLGKNGFEPSNSNKDYAVKKLQKLEHLFTGQDVTARVVCKVYPTYHKVEITLPTKNAILRSESKEKDIYAAIDISIDKLLGQVRKYKTKRDRTNKDGIKEVEQDDFFVYLDSSTHKTNVIYLRDDGDYAVIETKEK